MGPKLSIVIPVYNVAPYLEKCVTSCFNEQVSKESYEIILVNDGSTDESPIICKTLKEKYPSLQIINQENKGLSGARNTGLEKSKGKYVWFVDSDDWLAENCLPTILKMLNHNISIYWIGHDVWVNGKSTHSYIPNSLNASISGEELFANHLNHQFYIWKFIYKRDFLKKHQLRFLEGILYEDLEFTPRALQFATSCLTLDKVCYHYLVREGSIANKVTLKNIDHRFVILNNHVDILNTVGLSPIYTQALIKVIKHTAKGTIEMAARAGIMLPNSCNKLFKKIKQSIFKMGKGSFAYKLIGFSPSIYHFVYKILYRLYRLK